MSRYFFLYSYYLFVLNCLKNFTAKAQRSKEKNRRDRMNRIFRMDRMRNDKNKEKETFELI
jgi:hypothetical protein